MDYIREFNLKLQALHGSMGLYTVFKDFLTLSTCSLAQPFYRSPDLEQKYLDTIKQYTKEQAEEFSQLLALLVSGLEEKHQDFLGQVFMLNDFGNARKGQFFTPYHVSKFMAEITFTDVDKHIEQQGYITVSEPCCGSGGMVIAAAETLKEKGFNYQHQLYVEAVDIDEICFKMTYIQLSLLGIPAKVIRGDSIAMRYFEVLHTPFYFLSGFQQKIETRKNIDKMQKILTKLNTSTVEKETPKLASTGANQLTLFNF